MNPEDLWFQHTLAQQRQQAAIRQAQAHQLLIRLVQAHSATSLPPLTRGYRDRGGSG